MSPILRPRQGRIVQREKPRQQQHRLKTAGISSKWQGQRARHTPSKGLRNPGNLCYLNSVLQGLVHAPKVLNWLESHQSQLCAVTNCLVCALAKFGTQYWKDPEERGQIDVQVRGLQSQLSKTAQFSHNNWGWHIQHDAEEFLTLLLEAMVDNNPLEQRMMEGLFQHELITSLTCPHCKTTSEKFETSNILGAHFARATHLSQILRKTTFADNVIHDRECDNCKTRHDTRQKVRLACAPEVLAIQLARFTSTNTKNDAEVKFNRFLSLGPFMERQTRTDYELSCVVHHSGTMNSGHYKAVAVGPNGQWEELNDRVVTSVKLSAARKPAKPWTPYVLFYHRQNCHGGAETR